MALKGQAAKQKTIMYVHGVVSRSHLPMVYSVSRRALTMEPKAAAKVTIRA